MRTSKKPIYDLLSDLHAINVLNVNLNFSSSFRCYPTLLGAVSLALCVCECIVVFVFYLYVL